jgi:hypothetical protein
VQCGFHERGDLSVGDLVVPLVGEERMKRKILGELPRQLLLSVSRSGRLGEELAHVPVYHDGLRTEAPHPCENPGMLLWPPSVFLESVC